LKSKRGRESNLNSKAHPQLLSIHPQLLDKPSTSGDGLKLLVICVF
jgi:hypothetical protein